jgi:hypothetical protein
VRQLVNCASSKSWRRESENDHCHSSVPAFVGKAPLLSGWNNINIRAFHITSFSRKEACLILLRHKLLAELWASFLCENPSIICFAFNPSGFPSDFPWLQVVVCKLNQKNTLLSFQPSYRCNPDTLSCKVIHSWVAGITCWHAQNIASYHKYEGGLPALQPVAQGNPYSHCIWTCHQGLMYCFVHCIWSPSCCLVYIQCLFPFKHKWSTWFPWSKTVPTDSTVWANTAVSRSQGHLWKKRAWHVLHSIMQQNT